MDSPTAEIYASIKPNRSNEYESTSNAFQALAADAKTRITEISAEEAATRQQAGAVVIDVREAQEFAQQHIDGAVHGAVASWKLRSSNLCLI